MINGKSIALATTLTLLSLGSATSHASERNKVYMDACRAEIEQFYGERKNLAVVSKRRISEGTRVTIAARSNDDNAEFINCWIPNEEQTKPFDQGANAVATIVTPVPVIR